MKRHLTHLLALLALALPLATPAPAQTVILDRVAVVVDDSVIMESELADRLRTVMQNLQARGSALPPPDILRQEVTNMLVLESIQLQMAERAGVRISDAMLNEAIADIAARNNMTPEQFRNALASEGTSYEAMREQVRTQMLTQRVQRGHVGQKVHITEEEIDGFLASDEGRAMIAPELRLDHLLLELPETADAALADSTEAAARRLLAAAAHSSFARLATTPGLPVPVRHTDLGWRRAADIPSLFADAVTGMDTGDVAGPFRSGSGFHLVRVLERRGADRHIVQQTHARHLLVKPSEIRDDAQSRALATRLHQRIVAGEDFADIARQYSEDIGSAMEGGDLGWSRPGQFVPAFEEAMQRTAVGAISEPFRSDFGWHVLQVLERREKDLGNELQRNMARQHLFERKYQDELAAWLVKIRDEAYVDIK